MDYKELYRKAAGVMPNAYAPFSKFSVGAEERHTPAASADNFSTNLHRILTSSSGKTRRT